MRNLIWVLLAFAAPLAALEPANVLVVYNDKAAGSKDIADYYAGLRGIPASRVVAVSTSDKEEITREEFTKEILPAIQKAVADDDAILAVVPVRGVPLKIKDQDGKFAGPFEGHDEASVDSELTLLRVTDPPIDKAINNPRFDKDEPLTREHGVLTVCRLDGPSVAIVKGMIDKAIIAEALAPEGHSYLDTIGNPQSEGFQQRDSLMVKIADTWKEMGIPFSHDNQQAVQDLSTFKDPLHYYGWYAATQKPAGTVKFRTGAIAVHLHSFSAATVRGDSANWVGPLLHWGATCSFGTTYEPYTVGFPFEHLFWDRMAKGYSFGEAAIMSTQLLSWQAVFLGDPLYRPYRKEWKANRESMRASLAARLKGEGEETPASRLLAARAKAIADMQTTDAAGALALFQDTQWLLKDLGLDGWLAGIAASFETLVTERTKAMREAIKADLTDTAELEAAIAGWSTLPGYAEVQKLRDDTTKLQEREAASLLRKATASQRAKRWLRAWREAAECAAHRLSTSAPDAEKMLESLKEHNRTIKEEADKELKPIVERAQREFDRKRYDAAAKSLGRDWRYYPDCDQRRDAEKLAAQIAEQKN